MQCLFDDGVANDIQPSYDGACYQINKPDCVVAVGDNMTLNYQLDSLNVSFNAGNKCIIGGAFAVVESLEAVTLNANSTIYLCVNIDKSKPNSSRASIVQRTSSNMQKQSLNGDGTSRDLLLYVITTSANGVTNVQDKRRIIGNTHIMSETEFDGITPNQYDIYYVYED